MDFNALRVFERVAATGSFNLTGPPFCIFDILLLHSNRRLRKTMHEDAKHHEELFLQPGVGNYVLLTLFPTDGACSTS